MSLSFDTVSLLVFFLQSMFIQWSRPCNIILILCPSCSDLRICIWACILLPSLNDHTWGNIPCIWGSKSTLIPSGLDSTCCDCIFWNVCMVFFPVKCHIAVCAVAIAAVMAHIVASCVAPVLFGVVGGSVVRFIGDKGSFLVVMFVLRN